MQNNENGTHPVSDEELDNVSGGWQCGKSDKKNEKIVSGDSDVCAHWVCKHCGRNNRNGTKHDCSAGTRNYQFLCEICEYSEHRLGKGCVCTYSEK